MVVVGIVLLILAAIGVAAVAWTGRDVDVRLDGWGYHVTTSALGVFVAGAVAMLLVMLALWAFRRAGRRWRANRRELKQQRREQPYAESDARDGVHRDATDTDSAVDLREPAGAHLRPDHDPTTERRYSPNEERAD